MYQNSTLIGVQENSGQRNAAARAARRGEGTAVGEASPLPAGACFFPTARHDLDAGGSVQPGLKEK